MADEHELLVVRPAAPNPSVEGQNRPPLVGIGGKLHVVLLIEVGLAGMRAPQQPAHLDTPTGAPSQFVVEPSEVGRPIDMHRHVITAGPRIDRIPEGALVQTGLITTTARSSSQRLQTR